MTERKLQGEDEVVIELEETEADEIWKSIFTDLDKLSAIRNSHVTELAPVTRFSIFPEQAIRTIRINPAAATPEGKPRIVVIDTEYHYTPSQQIVLEAEWDGDTPTIVVNNPSKRGPRSTIIPYLAVGAIAATIMELRISRAEQQTSEISDIENPEHNLHFRVPDNYATGIN